MKVLIKDGGNLKRSIAEIFHDLVHKDLKNKKVFVKPNMLRIAKPEEYVSTHPRLISETVSFLLEVGADVLVGDNPIPQKVNEIEVAKKCGFLDAAQGRFKNVGRYIKRVKLPNRFVRETYISRDILECDLLISLPKFKTHELTTLSSAIKNHYGIVPGGLKPYYHYLCPNIKDFCELLLDIYRIRPPDIIIVDCLNIRDATGKSYNPEKIIAGDNGYAVDYVCGLIAGLKPFKDPVLRIAIEKKLFNSDTVEIVGEFEKLKDFALPITFPFRNLIVQFVTKMLFTFRAGWYPIVNYGMCTKCGSCENVCPRKAIKDRTIDYHKCIKCYCCIEVCPNGVMKKKFRI